MVATRWPDTTGYSMTRNDKSPPVLCTGCRTTPALFKEWYCAPCLEAVQASAHP